MLLMNLKMKYVFGVVVGWGRGLWVLGFFIIGQGFLAVDINQDRSTESKPSKYVKLLYVLPLGSCVDRGSRIVQGHYSTAW